MILLAITSTAVIRYFHSRPHGGESAWARLAAPALSAPAAGRRHRAGHHALRHPAGHRPRATPPGGCCHPPSAPPPRPGCAGPRTCAPAAPACTPPSGSAPTPAASQASGGRCHHRRPARNGGQHPPPGHPRLPGRHRRARPGHRHAFSRAPSRWLITGWPARRAASPPTSGSTSSTRSPSASPAPLPAEPPPPCGSPGTGPGGPPDGYAAQLAAITGPLPQQLPRLRRAAGPPPPGRHRPRPGSPGALLHRGPLRTVHARFPRTRPKQATGAAQVSMLTRCCRRLRQSCRRWQVACTRCVRASCPALGGRRRPGSPP